MLSVEKRFMIKDLFRKGVSISEIARLTGHDRKTIRAVLAEPLTAQRRSRQPKSRKIEPYIAYLEKRIQDGVLNADKLYHEICQQGYSGKDRQVRAFVQPYRAARRRQATMRYETEPGQQAQVDWGHFGLIEHQGRQRRLYAFVMTLGWSRMMYLEFTILIDLVWWLRCHIHAFHYFGGVPRQMLHDNLKTAVLERDAEGKVHWQPRYLDFAGYYGFSPRACQPYRAQTKGKVERGIRYVRGNFWPGLRFTNLADLNRQARIWLDTIANTRVHGTTGAVPFDRLGREGLQPVAGKPDYDTSLIGYRRSSRDGLISYRGNYYSIPVAFVPQRLMVKETEGGQLVILTPDGNEVARHDLVEGRNQRQIVAGHVAGLPLPSLPSRRTTALQVDRRSAPEVEARPLSVYDQLVEVEA